MADRVTKVTLLAEVSGYLRGLEQAKSKTKEMSDDAKKRLEAQTEALGAVGKASVAMGAAAALGVGAAVKAYADFDAKMAQVRSLSHASADDMSKLSAATFDFAEKYGISASQAADAEIELVKGGVSVKDMINGGLKGALELASAGQIDVGEATSIAVSAMTQFHLKGQDVSHIADLLSAGADKALGSVSDLGQGLKYVGPVASSMGISIEQTVGTLSELAQNGILADQAGTSLRGMLSSLTAPSAQAASVMKQLGISVYDSQGKFIGFDGVAQQLQDHTKNLTEAQRNQALGQIFGNQQITAATILMQGGAKAVDKWTKAVDESGFAGLQASGKLDTLSGDVLKLKAAFDNGLIESGSASDGVLRGLVQTATNLISIFDGLPKPLQQAALGVGGFTAAVGLLGGGMILAVPKVAAFNATLGTLSEGTGNIARGAGALKTGLGATAAFLAGPWGLAIGGAAALVGGIFVKSQLDAKKRVDDLRDSLDQETAAITKSTRAMVAKSLQDDGAFTTAKKLGLELDTVTDAALGNKDAIDKVRTAVDAYSKAHEALGSKQKNPLQLEAQTFAQNVLGEADALKKAREAQNDLIAAQQTGTTSASDASSAASDASSSIADLGGSADDATDALDDLANALSGLGGTQRDVESATIAYKDAIQSVTDSVKENGRGLDDNTAAGRKNNQSLLDLAASITDLAGKQAATGATTETLTGTIQAGRAEFIKAAEAAGATADQAAALADKYGLIPANVSTAVSASGIDSATQKAIDYTRALLAIPSKRETLIEQVMQQTGAAHGVVGAAYATGGLVHGPGTGTSDSIVARLSAGEFVVKADQTAKYRPVLEAINSGMFEDSTPRFAAGGLVANSFRQSRPSFDYRYAAPVATSPTVNVAPATVNLEGMRAVFNIGGRQIEAVIESIADGVVQSNASADARTIRNGKPRYR